MNTKTMKNFRRLIEFLKKCSNGISVYAEIKEDLKLLCCGELKENIKSELAHILPGLLILASNGDDSIMKEVIAVFSVINEIVSRNIELKTERWWKEMESNIIPNKFFTGVISLIEKKRDYWDETWIFAVSLMINDNQIHGSTVNSLLKIMEVAFKKSLKDDSDAVMNKAFNCWMKFIEIFTSNPRIILSKKLISLLIKPLTIPMGSGSHLRIIQTYKYVYEKLGKSGDKNIAFDIVNPFLEHSYKRNEDCLSRSHPDECCEILIELLSADESTKLLFILPVLSVYSVCLENKTSQQLLITLWTRILDCSSIIDINKYEEYLEKIISERQKVLNNKELLKDYGKLGDFLINKGLPAISPELLDKLLTSGELSPKVLADMMECNELRTKTFANYFNQFINNVNIEADKKETSSVSHMEKWDTFCAAFNLFIDSKGYQFQENDSQTFKSLILFPLQTHAKWAGVTQRTWHSIIDSIHKQNILKPIIPDIILTLNLNLDDNKVSTSTVIDIISHLINLDKTAPITSLIDKILVKLPKEDAKNAIDLLAFIETLIGYGDKKQYLSGVLSELLRICTSYDQLYEHRIKTKVSKLHRKLILDSKTDQKDKEKESKTPSPKIRSPLLTGSSFLHRLAKSEEKKAMCLVSPPLIGDNAKNSYKVKGKTKLSECDDEKDKEEVTILKDKTLEENISKEVTLPKTVNIVINDHPNKVGNNQITIKSPEEHLNVKSKLQNGDNFSPSSIKPISKKTAISYFEDDSQEFVIVPPKPKSNTPLTDHQKEVLQRKSIIPAMYQDLTQDTQSISNITMPEIFITAANDSSNAVDEPIEKSSDRHEVSKESDLIEVTPPSEELATTPLKARSSFSASKKLNFEGLVKTNSPVCNDKQDGIKNSQSSPNVTPTSRRMSQRKTTSKYGTNRIITPSKDLDDQQDLTKEINSLPPEEMKQKKGYGKAGVSCKKSLELKSVEEIKPNEDTKSKSEEKETSAEIICDVDMETGKKSDQNKTEQVINADVKNSDVQLVDESSDFKVENLKEANDASNEKKGCESTDKLISDIESFISDTELIVKDESSNKQDSIQLQVDSKLNGTSEKSVNEGTPEKQIIVEDEKNNSLNKADNQISENRADNVTPPSAQRVRRPRKKTPTPFSPKLTRSKKLSLQNKLISPKSPKDLKAKVRAPKPNTECFSSDSNDSISGVVPLVNNETKTTDNDEQVGKTTEENVKNNFKRSHSEMISTNKVLESVKTVKDDEKSKVPEEKLSEKSESADGNENVIKKRKFSDVNEPPPGEKSKHSDRNEKVIENLKHSNVSEDVAENFSLPSENEKSKLPDGNETSEPQKKTRKRKMQSMPEESNDRTNTQEVRIVSVAKRGRKKGSFSQSPRISSGLDHWLFKKDKNSTNSTLDNKDLEKKSTDDILNEASSATDKTDEITKSIPSPVQEADLERNNIEAEIVKENLLETVDGSNDEETKIMEVNEEANQFNDIVDTEIVICEETGECASPSAEDIVASSQNTQLSEGLFSQLNKKENSTALEKCVSSTSENDHSASTDDSSAQPTVTKLEKVSKGMKTCDLIFKGGEIEEKIIIYMAQPPTSPSSGAAALSSNIVSDNSTECPQPSADAQSLHTSNTEQDTEIIMSSCDEKPEFCTILSARLEKDDTSSTDKSSTDSAGESAMEQSDLVHIVSTDNDTDIDKSDKSLDKLGEHSIIELVDNKDITIISNEVEFPVVKSEQDEEKTSLTFLTELKNEVICVDSKECNLPENNDMEIADVEVNITEEKSNQINIEPGGEQNNSEQLFKNDTPKRKGGARFIHTTESDEGDDGSAEDRRRRNYRSRRITVEDINSLSGCSARSKHMIQLAQQGRNSRINISRKRPNIKPIIYGPNWPTGPTEDWIAERPTTPALCLSPGILKPSPLSSTPVSPSKKKRVNFLDPPVSLGLLYEKHSKIGIGQLHYAEVSPGKSRMRISEEEISIEKKIRDISDNVETGVEVKVISTGQTEENGGDKEISESVSVNYESYSPSRRDDKEGGEQSLTSIVINTEDSSTLSDSSVVSKEPAIETLDIDIAAGEAVVDDINETNEDNIPTVEQLKSFINNKTFIDNLALAVINSDSRDFWYQQLFTSVNEHFKK
ncbi:hypothetical protein O3M35_009926 [Rhynocoris fuscipes]|uniref:Telomere-associated protein RIF1 n=1 Tax=Rhynocoris fuscipes TaxID=488301 RepID=A0AAW1D7F5_9HEMI